MGSPSLKTGNEDVPGLQPVWEGGFDQLLCLDATHQGHLLLSLQHLFAKQKGIPPSPPRPSTGRRKALHGRAEELSELLLIIDGRVCWRWGEIEDLHSKDRMGIASELLYQVRSTPISERMNQLMDDCIKLFIGDLSCFKGTSRTHLS